MTGGISLLGEAEFAGACAVAGTIAWATWNAWRGFRDLLDPSEDTSHARDLFVEPEPYTGWADHLPEDWSPGQTTASAAWDAHTPRAMLADLGDDYRQVDAAPFDQDGGEPDEREYQWTLPSPDPLKPQSGPEVEPEFRSAAA